MDYNPEPLPNAKTHPLAIISLVTGILSMIIAPCYWLLCVSGASLLFGSAAAVMGFISLRKIKSSEGALSGRGMAIAGLSTGLVGLIGGIMVILISWFVVI